MTAIERLEELVTDQEDIDIYTDYHDVECIPSIVKDCDTLDDFYEHIYDAYSEYSSDICYDIWNDAVEKVIDEFEIEKDSDEYFELADFMDENRFEFFNVNEPDFMDTMIKCDIFFNLSFEDIGDYLPNEKWTYEDNKLVAIARDSDFMEILNVLGYSAKDFIKGYQTDKTLKNIYDALFECTAGYVYKLTFLVECTVSEYYEAKGSAITIDCGNVGFVNTWQGAGSTLEIDIDKPVYLPKDSFTIYQKDSYSYSVDEIYGLCGDAWNGSIIVEEEK